MSIKDRHLCLSLIDIKIQVLLSLCTSITKTKTGIHVCLKISVSKSKSEPQEHSVDDALGAIREHFNHRVTQADAAERYSLHSSHFS